MFRISFWLMKLFDFGILVTVPEAKSTRITLNFPNRDFGIPILPDSPSLLTFVLEDCCQSVDSVSDVVVVINDTLEQRRRLR